MWRGGLIGVVAAVAACSAPGYDLTATFTVLESEALSFQVDHQPAMVTTLSRGVSISVERHYDSYAAALDAPAILIEAFRDGQLVWTWGENPAVCDSFGDACGEIVAADYRTCFFADGTPGASCSGLSCADEDGLCGTVVSGPPAPPGGALGAL